MPLSKARMRERKRLDRADVKPKSNLTDDLDVKPSIPKHIIQPEAVRMTFSVTPKSGKPVIPKIPGLIIQGNRIVGLEKATPKEVGVSRLEFYNPDRHKAGDRVLMMSPYNPKKVAEVVVPEVDADGNIVPEW